MPRIFDNIDQSLLPALRETLVIADRADFCVGYFNLHGWKQIDELVECWSGGPPHCCRLLVGMQRLPKEELRDALSVLKSGLEIDNQTAIHWKTRLAQEFRDQLMLGIPTNQDEAGLRRLAAQIRGKKLVVKLYLRHPLHAKLYLLFRPDPITPTVGYLGSSNLTFAGLAQQGELNVDVVEQDACAKLARWFEERWEDRWCIDISKELLEIIEQSWAREDVPSPYVIYIKMAYHLSQEARTGLADFRLPRDFADMLFEFQVAAVKIAAHHLNKRGGVLIGDVVGLGKTLMATAVARIFEDDHGLETLILCPKNLVPMWEDHRQQFGLRGRVLSISRAIRELPERVKRYRLVLIDESHNLRNREGKRYRVIRDYIQRNESKVMLLSATPYNKTYLDLASQLRLFLADDVDIGIRPETLLREIGETEFIRRHQCGVRTLAAFEKSDKADDWRELMRLYARIPGDTSVFHLEHVHGRLWPVILWRQDEDYVRCPAVRSAAATELTEAVAAAKRHAGGSGGGAFQINEFGYVIVPASDTDRRWRRWIQIHLRWANRPQLLVYRSARRDDHRVARLSLCPPQIRSEATMPVEKVPKSSPISKKRISSPAA